MSESFRDRVYSQYLKPAGDAVDSAARRYLGPHGYSVLERLARAADVLGSPAALSRAEQDMKAGRYLDAMTETATLAPFAKTLPAAAMAFAAIRPKLPAFMRDSDGYAKTARPAPGHGSEAGKLPGSGGVPGGPGVLEASGRPVRAAPATALGDGYATIPGVGGTIVQPIPEVMQAADSYMRRTFGTGYKLPESYPAFDPDRARAIAGAYDRMAHAPSDPTVKRAYEAMLDETLGQYRALKDSGIDFKFLKPGQADPYARSPSLGYLDMMQNGRLWVFPTDFGFGSSAAFDAAQNPLLRRVGKIGDLPDATANDAFRAVHDAYGHFGPGNPFFRAPGEERAWLSHSRMYSPEARPAMTTETRGQNSWVNFGPHAEHNKTASGGDTIYADQKTGLMPPWTWADGPFVRTPE